MNESGRACDRSGSWSVNYSSVCKQEMSQRSLIKIWSRNKGGKKTHEIHPYTVTQWARIQYIYNTVVNNVKSASSSESISGCLLPKHIFLQHHEACTLRCCHVIRDIAVHLQCDVYAKAVLSRGDLPSKLQAQYDGKFGVSLMVLGKEVGTKEISCSDSCKPRFLLRYSAREVHQVYLLGLSGPSWSWGNPTIQTAISSALIFFPSLGVADQR